MSDIVKKSIFVCAVGALLAPLNVSAHETFIAEVGFEIWERHCHEYVIRGTDECWAVYQKRIDNSESHERGFVIIIHEKQNPFSFELRNVNLFGHTIEVIIDDNQTHRLACHSAICTPFKREDANRIIDQMKTGKKMLIRNSRLPNETMTSEETIPLAGFSAALTR